MSTKLTIALLSLLVGLSPFVFVSVAAIPPKTITIELPQEANEVVQEVKKPLPDIPDVLLKALSCESSYEATPTSTPRQFNKDGSVRKHYNENGSIDWGAAMINDKTWDATAKQLGLDYKNSLNDNLKMAFHIYKIQGIGAWFAYNPKTEKCVWQDRYFKQEAKTPL